MNDVGGSESGTGQRPKSSRGSASDANFEYDDEWDVGIGNLISDLDADIEKNNEANQKISQQLQSSSPPSSSSPQMHIPHSTGTTTSNSNSSVKSGKTGSAVSSSSKSGSASSSNVGSVSRTESNIPSSSVNMEHSSVCGDKGLKMKIKRTKPGTKNIDAKHEIVKNDILSAAAAGTSLTANNSSSNNSSASTTLPKVISTTSSDSNKGLSANLCSNKTVKDKGGGDEGSSNEGNKLKTQKKVASHIKKIRIGGNTTSPASSVVGGLGLAANVGKKDSEFKSQNFSSTSSSSNTASFGSSSSSGNSTLSNKSDVVNVPINVPSVSSSLTSAFVKTTPLKIPVQQSGSIHGTHPGSDSNISGSLHLSSNANQQSLKNPTVQLTVSASPAKDKAGLSGVGANGSFSEKSSQNSLSNYAKKARVLSHDKAPAQDSDNRINSTTGAPSSHQKYLLGADSTSSRKDNSASSRENDQDTQDACVGTSVGTVTEPDCLGPCEPGTSVTLEGIVWHETENGVLVVNVTWRGKTYVGTLLDCTKNEWASPRFCDSPTSDLETRTPKNRGKRGRAQGSGTPVLESNPSPLDALRASATKLRNGAKGRRGSSTPSAPFLTPLSPLKVDPWPKRKTRGSENEQEETPASTSTKTAKRLKISKELSSSNLGGSPVSGSSTCTNAAGQNEAGPNSPVLIECPEPNCSKKYKHINGLKYHQSHAHTPQFVPAEDSDSNMSTTSTTNLTACTISSDTFAESSVVIDPVEFTADVPKLDIEETEFNSAAISVCDESSSSAPTTPMKIICKGTEENVRTSLNAHDEIHPDLPEIPMPILQDKTKPDDIETMEDDVDNEIKEFNVLPHQPRTPILTVPSFVSLQNRSSHQIGADQKNKGGNIPWQPHSTTSNSVPAQHSHGPLQLTVPNVQALDKSISKESKTSPTSLLSTTKKSKHKKKSKDKRDREHDGHDKSRTSGENLRNEHDDNASHGGSPSLMGRLRDERKSSSETLDDESERRIRVDSRDRDDPHSPAYSDISDANDSGPESDLGGKELNKTIGTSGNPEQLTKEVNSSPGAVHSYSSFYSPAGIFSPYTLGEGNTAGSVIGLGSSTPLNASMRNIDRDRGGGESPGKGKPTGPGAGIIPNHSDDRRSPKQDYQSKYLPQHYYSYPYSNFHGFEQSPYGLLPENYNAHNRAFAEEREREIQNEQLRKSKSGSENGKEVNLVNIKQEPLTEKERNKEPGSAKTQQSNFSKGSTSGSSKSSKDYNKRDKEEKERDRHSYGHGHSKGDNSNHNHKTGSSKSGHHQSDRDRERQSGKHSVESESSDREKNRDKNEGSKPTMETTGPPPPPTAGSYAYLPPGYLQANPFGLPFDATHPLYRQVIVPGGYPGPPYGMHPGGLPRFPPTPVSTSIPLPEDLSRPSPPTSVPSSKGLDMLQHHATYYASHKIHELQERALKSPIPQTTTANPQPTSTPSVVTGSGQSAAVNKPSSPAPARKDTKPLELKESKPTPGQLGSTSPPTQHHVHSHHHQHHHTIGFPILPTVPPQYSPHYVIPPAATTPIPPFTSQKPT